MSSSVLVQRWYPVHLSDRGDEGRLDDLLRILSHAGLPARLGHGCAGLLVEVFCNGSEEAARADVLLCQLVADQRLRREIEKRAAPQIVALVDGVIARAAGN